MSKQIRCQNDFNMKVNVDSSGNPEYEVVTCHKLLGFVPEGKKATFVTKDDEHDFKTRCPKCKTDIFIAFDK